MIGIAPGGKLNAGARLGHDLDLMAGSDAHAFRWYPSWARVEPDLGSGDFDFTEPDAVILGATQRGLAVLIGVGTRGDGHMYDVAHLDAIGPYAAALAERYPLALGFEGVNEGFFTKVDPQPTPERYVACQGRIYTSIKRVLPHALVGTGGIIGSAQHLVDLYAVGAKAWFDFVAWHPYTYPLSPTQSLHQQHGGFYAMREARAVMVANGDAHKQIWATEFGSPTLGKTPVTEKQQADDLYNAVSSFRRHAWAGPFFNFCGWDSDDPHDEGFGLYRADDSEKASLHIFRMLAEAT